MMPAASGRRPKRKGLPLELWLGAALLLAGRVGGVQPFACGTLSGAKAAQCAALGDLYAALNGSSWRRNSGWAQAAAAPAVVPDPCASFYGVSCDANGLVTQMCAPSTRCRACSRGARARTRLGRERSATLRPIRVCPATDACVPLLPLRSALSRNLVRGDLPASLGNIASLESLQLDSNFIFGTVPASIAALPALRNMTVADNFMVGDLPAGLASLSKLGLDKNNFASATLPASLCAFACASVEGFACPFAASACSCRAAPVCRGSCPASLTWLANALAVSCGDINTACINCMSAMLPPYLLAGVSPADTTTLGFCIVADEAKHLAAGASPAALDSLRYCQYTRPLDAGVACPIVVPEATGLRIWSDAAASQCSPLVVSATFAPCQRCAMAIQQPFLDAGCPEDYDLLTACYASHITTILSAGIISSTLALLASCPPTFSTETAKVDDVVLGAALGGTLGGVFVLGVVALAFVTARRRNVKADGLSPLPGSFAPGSYPEARDFSARSALSSSGSLLLRAEDVVLGAVIGKGGFATVHAARWRGSAVAAKLFMLQRDDLANDSPPPGIAAAMDSYVRFHIKSEAQTVDDERQGAAYERELMLLQSLRHPNICTLYGVVVSPPMLIMELCAAGSLAALLRVSTLETLPWTRRADIGAGVACGVDFLHGNDPPVIHRDLKSLNVVLASDGTAKLVDFGLGGFLPHVAGELASKDKAAKGTPAFMPPELIMSIPGGTPQAIDIFGVGVVLHDLAHLGIFSTPQTSSTSSSSNPSADTPLMTTMTTGGSREQNAKGMMALLERHTAGYTVKVAPHCPKALGELMLRCMRREPATRPSAGEVLLLMLQLSAAAAEAEARGDAWA
jgi:serine/threonine protein kinase